MEDKNIKKSVLTIKPKFDLLYFFVNRIALTLIAVVIFAIMISDEGINQSAIYILVAYIVFAIFLIIWNRRKMKNKTYYFFDDVLVIDKNGKKEKIPYSEIEDIRTYKRNYAHNFFNRGNLVFKIRNKNIITGSVDIYDLDNYEENVKKIGQIVLKIGE